jgi:alkyl sulfatase BDS1-like metallo-beta-lactamase superfamily hydrolase
MKQTKQPILITSKDGRFNFVDADNKIISSQWFDDCGDFDDADLAWVVKDSKHNYINTDGKIMLNQWYDDPYKAERAAENLEN